MNMDEQKLTYEQFKEDILQWKNTHREEYNRFSRLMTNGDERQSCHLQSHIQAAPRYQAGMGIVLER